MAIYGNMTQHQASQAAIAAGDEETDQKGEKPNEGDMVMDKLHEDFQKKLHQREDDLRKHLQKTTSLDDKSE